METKLPLWRTQIQIGDTSGVKDWLTKQIFSHGNLHDPMEFLKKVTGRVITITPYLEYLYEKYSQLYNF